MCFQMLTGNVNTFVAETRVVSPPIVARKVRVVPYSSHPRTVCLRLELYGCTWKGRSPVVITDIEIHLALKIYSSI